MLSRVRESIRSPTDELTLIHDNQSKVVCYTYDAFGRRSTRTVGNTTWRYVYAGPWLIQELVKVGVGSETLEAKHYFGISGDDVLMSRRIDIADLDQDQSTTDMVDLYLHRNHQGSVTDITVGSNATVVETYRYDPFGTPTIRDRTGTLVGSAPSGNRWAFTGREWDSLVGLYHYRAREYDPSTGTFLQEDPLGYADDLNPVVYALANPVSYVDPTGMSGIMDALNDLVSFISENAALIGSVLLDIIPGAEALLDALSALAGRDLTEWLKGGARGQPESLSFWGRLRKGGRAAIRLLGSIAGTLFKIRSIYNKVKKLVQRARARARAQADAQRMARRAGGCFVVGTLVWLAGSELVPIEQVAVGNAVASTVPLSSDRPVGGDSHYAVRGLSWTWYEGALHTVVVESPRGTCSITGTPEHPFWSQVNRRWVKLAELRVGERLNAVHGDAVVKSRSVRFGALPVCNLSVRTSHTYRVGELGILVHNGCPKRRARIREILADPDTPSHIRGWITQEIRNGRWRVPPGYQLAHKRGRRWRGRRRSGYNHQQSPSNFQTQELHNHQHHRPGGQGY